MPGSNRSGFNRLANFIETVANWEQILYLVELASEAILQLVQLASDFVSWFLV